MFDLVGETLRRLRKERGKTLEQLGVEAGLGRGQLSRIENARQEATLSTLAKILGSQGVGRREFFRRYDLVEAEAQAVQRVTGQLQAPERVERPETEGPWPDAIRELLGRVESFVQGTLQQPRPIAQGAVEVGDVVVLFRVVPKGSQQDDWEPEGGGEAAPQAPQNEPGAPRKRNRKKR
jgi:transcriptional regulator with XRE-family HTH domain